VTLVVASAGGLFLANRALRPVDRITRTAQTISANDLSRRLDPDLPDDELGRLARTLDAMIARLDEAFRRQRRFTADASHELRTPLTIIKGDLSLALARPRDADYYHSVLTIVYADQCPYMPDAVQ
jgi:signal transduction histidine kinase